MIQKNTALFHRVVEEMIHLDRFHRAACDRRTAVFGMHRSNLRMLAYLYFKEEAASQKEIAEQMHITPAVVAVAVKRLQEEGYLERTPCSSDRRAYEIVLTPKGVAAVEQTHAILDTVDKGMLSGFTDQEMEQLLCYFGRMHENLKRSEEGAVCAGQNT